MLSHENDPSDQLKSVEKSTVKHSSTYDNFIEDDSLLEVEHQLNSSSVEGHSFSIRDFVLSARNKDIWTNWPFANKHLKLCLKHGVKDLLPPFQSKVSRKKQFSPICLDINSSVDKGNSTRIPNEEPSANADSLTEYFLGDVDHLGVTVDRSDKESDFPSSVTSSSQAYPSASGGTFKHHKYPKTLAKTSASKCKLIVKFGSPSVHSSNEDIMPHKTNISDSLASKVCPVCKMFSSSSNTTLNAHIDQCLSMETASEGITDFKIGTKCKVKLRKMRSMVDIYATALVCTIEDLDRRNGSSWATDLSSPARVTAVNSPQENKKLITSPTDDPDKEEDDDDGGVYIDANGRKLRILSKMDSFSSVVTTKEDHGSGKPQTGKILSRSRKNHRGTEHQKYLEHPVSGKKFFAPKANLSKVSRSQKASNDVLGSKHASYCQIKRSRDTDERETFRNKGMHQKQVHKLRAVQRSSIKSQKSCLSSSFHKFYKDSDSCKKMKSSDDIHCSTKCCLGVKRTGLSISKDDNGYKTYRNGHKRLKRSTEYFTDSTHVGKISTWKPLKQLNRPESENDKNRPSPVRSISSTEHIRRFLHKSSKLHKNNTSSLCQQTLCSTNEEDQVETEAEEEEDEDWDEDKNVHVIHDTMPEGTENQHATIGSILNKMEQDKRTVIQLKEVGALNMSVNTCDEFVENPGAPLSGSEMVGQGTSDTMTDHRKNSTAERTMRSFIRSMNPDIHERSHSYAPKSSLQPSKDPSTEPNSAPCRPDTVIGDEMSDYSNMELESDSRQCNLSSGIDPIPIPGPPGSFLPSPGNAETEECQGNSSLTASLSSSHEQVTENLLGSADSPMSSASNLAAEMSEKVVNLTPSTGTPAIPDSSMSRSPYPNAEISIVEAPLFPQASNVGVSQSEYGNQKSYVKLQDNAEPCCCSRKERVQRGSVVDYQESQLLRRRTKSAVVTPAKENISCSLNTVPSYTYAGSDIYSLSSSSSFRVDAFPVLEKPAGFTSPKGSVTMNAKKLNANGDSEYASPSAVLRLMGKNLMVVKNDEGLSYPSGDAASSDTNTQILKSIAASPCKPPNHSYSSQFQRAVPQDPAVNHPSHGNVRHSLDFRMLKGPWGEINFLRPALTSHSQAVLAGNPEMHINRGVQRLLDNNKWPTQQCVLKNGFDAVPDQMNRGKSSSIDFRKPSMIKDGDGVGREIGAWKRDITLPNCTKGNATMHSDHTQSRLIYPVYHGFPPALSSAPLYMQPGSGSSCFPVPFSSSRSLNPQANYSQNGSSVLQGGGPFMASSTTIHPRPGLFYSPRLP